ncbi:hypothetical protein AB0G49_14325 [Streptomyces longwoodensis]|uniref:hypothetical protein n=1 Tax=Streptomyces longwoodensis TaxID=68231 RepID=UPI0033E63D7C
MTETKPLPVRGRPALLTADMFAPIVRAVEEGKTRAETAAAAGVSEDALLRWLGRGRQLRTSGAATSSLTGHNWLCLRLLWSVEEAKERREQARAKAAAAAAEPPKAVGRPPLLTAALVNTVLSSLSAGDGRAVAAAAAGVTARTLQRWLTRGARGHFGVAYTEYDALCARLYRGVKDVEKSAGVTPAAATPELEKKELPGPSLVGSYTVSAEMLKGKVVDASPDRVAVLPNHGVQIIDRATGQPLAAVSGPVDTGRAVIDIRPPRGRVRSWLRSRLRPAKGQ